MFCKVGQRLNTGNCFCQKLHLRCFTQFWNVSDYCLWIRLSFFYYFFHFASIKFRSSLLHMLFKIEVLKHLAIFTGKQLYWSLLVIKLPGYRPANFIYKRLPYKYFCINIAKFLRTGLFIEFLRCLYFKAMFETCQNVTMKNEKGFY